MESHIKSKEKYKNETHLISSKNLYFNNELIFKKNNKYKIFSFLVLDEEIYITLIGENYEQINILLLGYKPIDPLCFTIEDFLTEVEYRKLKIENIVDGNT